MSRSVLPSVRGLAVAALAVALGSGCGKEAPPPPASGVTTVTPGVLTVCLYPGFAPFVYQEGDAWKGWDHDFMQDFATKLGLGFAAYKVDVFDGMWLLPGKDKCDIAATGISDLPERRRATCPGGVWSDHYYRVVRAFAIRPGDEVDGIEDLAGKHVIVTDGSTADLDLVNRLAQAGLSATIERTNDERGSAIRVRDGQGPDAPFAYGGGYGSIVWLANDLQGLELAWPHCYMQAEGGEVAEPFSFVVRAASTGVAEALDAYIANPTHPYQGELPPLSCPDPPAPPKCPAEG